MRENWHLSVLNISKIHELKTTILSLQISKRHEFQKYNSLMKAKLEGNQQNKLRRQRKLSKIGK